MIYLKRTALVLIALELAYLAIFNTLLNLQLTQDLINRIKPDKFAANWDSAWTPYPFRVHASGVSANGQARSQQWFLKAPQASGSISLLPLLWKTVSLSQVNALDVTYYQRPRPREDKDISAIREFFPPIEGRILELKPPSLSPLKPGKKPWNIEIQDMVARGEHKLWLYQIQASINGDVHTDMSFITRGGPFSLSNGALDLRINSILLNGDREMSSGGHLKGAFEMLPLVIKKNKGIKALTFLNLDINLDTQTDSLAFLNIYLHAFEGMNINGSGDVQGKIIFEQGKLLPGSEIEIVADDLKLKLLEYRTEGDGIVNIQVKELKTNTSDGPDTHFAIAFNSLNTFYANQPEPLFTGNGLVLNGTGGNQLIPIGEETPEARSLALYIASLHVPDLGKFQHFLPKKWSLKLKGGEGDLSGQASVDQSHFSSDFQLNSEQADIAFNDYRFSSNLDMRTRINAPDLLSGLIDVSGTYVKIGNTKISSEEEESDPWHADISIDKGNIQLDIEALKVNETSKYPIAKALKSQDTGTLLSSASQDLEISGRISDLRWLNVLINNPYNFTISGNGGVESNIVVDSGWLAEGTELSVIPQALSVGILDYVAEGDGNVDLKVIKGGEYPDLSLALNIRDALFRREQEQQSFIENVEIMLQATLQEMNLSDKKGGDMTLRLQIPTAKIRDMSIYNQYLPEQSPLQILSGEADLKVDIALEQDDAEGYVRLSGRELRAHVDEQEISAGLNVDINISGGVPEKMEFDISGSTIKLDEVKVIGEQASFRDEDWAANILFEEANTVWKKPIQLDVKSKIQMTDSIPIVSMMANHKGKETWLSKALTIDDVAGEIDLKIANEQIVIPYAFASSDNIDVGAKAIISKENRNGMLYVRYKKLKGLLKINDGKRNIDVLNVQEKFDAYSTKEVIQEKDL